MLAIGTFKDVETAKDIFEDGQINEFDDDCIY